MILALHGRCREVSLRLFLLELDTVDLNFIFVYFRFCLISIIFEVDRRCCSRLARARRRTAGFSIWWSVVEEPKKKKVSFPNT